MLKTKRMKTIKQLSLLLMLAVVTVACISKKRFLEEQQAKNKAFKSLSDAKKENKRLNENLKALLADTTKLGEELRKIGLERKAVAEDLADLQTKYKTLEKSSKLTTDELRGELSKKETELLEKEKALKEREKTVLELRNAISKKEDALQALLDKVNKSLVDFNPDELTVEKKNGKIYVSLAEKLLFKSGRASVEAKGKEALGKLAEVLKKNLDIDIVVEGHTDNIPIKTAIFKDNWDLSVIRATSIVRILTEDYGMLATRITPAGRGDEFPIASNETKEGRAKNRRVEIILSPKLDELLKIIEGN